MVVADVLLLLPLPLCYARPSHTTATVQRFYRVRLTHSHLVTYGTSWWNEEPTTRLTPWKLTLGRKRSLVYGSRVEHCKNEQALVD